jgi:hypothetical protein
MVKVETCTPPGSYMLSDTRAVPVAFFMWSNKEIDGSQVLALNENGYVYSSASDVYLGIYIR